MPTFSPSALDLFERCPLAYRLRYVDRVDDTLGETIEQYLGKTVHATLEWLHGRASDGARPMWHEILEDFHDRYDGRFHDAIRIVKPERTREGYRAVGEKCLRNYFEANTPFDDEGLVAIEWDFHVPLAEDPASPRLRGRVDRISRVASGHLRIHDYKTGGYVPSRQDLERSRQPLIYALAVGRAFPETTAGRIELVWHYLQSGMRVPFEIRPARLERGARAIGRLIEQIGATTRFAARPSPLCPWCEFGHLCPELSYRRRVTTTTAREPEPDVALVDRLERLTRLRREFEKAFRREKAELDGAVARRADEEGVTALVGTRMEAVVGDGGKVRLRKRRDE
jgi:putative RecB family exonuclease